MFACVPVRLGYVGSGQMYTLAVYLCLELDTGAFLRTGIRDTFSTGLFSYVASNGLLSGYRHFFLLLPSRCQPGF